MTVIFEEERCNCQGCTGAREETIRQITRPAVIEIGKKVNEATKDHNGEDVLFTSAAWFVATAITEGLSQNAMLRLIRAMQEVSVDALAADAAESVELAAQAKKTGNVH